MILNFKDEYVRNTIPVVRVEGRSEKKSNEAGVKNDDENVTLNDEEGMQYDGRKKRRMRDKVPSGSVRDEEVRDDRDRRSSRGRAKRMRRDKDKENDESVSEQVQCPPPRIVISNIREWVPSN